MFKKFLFGILATIILSNAQEFYVEYQKIEGELTTKDLYKENFGRYDGFQLPLNKGERVHFIVFSEDFSPSLVLVTPNDTKYQQASARGDDFITMGLKVPKSGEWLLYVLGDSTSEGKYFLQYAFADSASLFLSDEADFCTGLNFILAHSNAYFIFPQTIPSNRPLHKLEGSIDAFINSDDAAYVALFYEGDDLNDAKGKFGSVISSMQSCLTNGWKKEEAKSSETMNSVTWSEDAKNNPRVITIMLNDTSEIENGANYQFKYVVELVVMKY